MLREGCEVAVQLFGPMMPHLAEELWRHLGHSGLLADQPWPKADPALVVEDSVTIAVQVNGKLRASSHCRAMPSGRSRRPPRSRFPAIQRALEGKKPRKIIVVPNRIINVVV